MRTRPTLSRSLLLGSSILMLAGVPAAAAPSTNATVNLIQLLIKNKVITKSAGDALLAQAEAEAEQARVAEAKVVAPAPAAAATVVAGAAALPPPAPGAMRVPYIPETVRAAMTDEIKEDILAQAEFEGWAHPKQVPAWVKSISLYGDVRFRSQSNFYSAKNAVEQIDFQTFNDISPIDINANTNPTGFPLLNTQTNRTNLLRLRARLGVLATISDRLSVGARIASGDDNSPISTNQTLGGGLTKKDIWLDQAWLKFAPTKWSALTVGRMPNPFISTEMVFDEDLNFDGATLGLEGKPWLPENVTAGVTLGAYPFGYSPANFPTNAAVKSADDSKWLFAVQGRAGWLIDERIQLGGAVAYYDFTKTQGELSQPCALYNGNKQCSTDTRRPVSLRKGNTLFLMRDILPDPANPLNYAQPQVLGQAFKYQVLDVHANVHVPLNDKLGIDVEGSYINNLGYDRSALCRTDPKGLPINNITLVDPVSGASATTAAGQPYANPCTPDATGRRAIFDGGNQGWTVRALVGTAKPKMYGEWNVELGYRYVQSDATLDSLSDSEFHLGGTNAKGYILGGRYALHKNLVLGGRWLSTNEVSGPPLAIDVLLIDLVASF